MNSHLAVTFYFYHICKPFQSLPHKYSKAFMCANQSDDQPAQAPMLTFVKRRNNCNHDQWGRINAIQYLCKPQTGSWIITSTETF